MDLKRILSEEKRIPVFRLGESIFLTLAVLFFILPKFFSLSIPNQLVADEKYYVEAALKYSQGNSLVNLEHPPLGKLLIQASTSIFGQNLAAARLPSLIFGTFGIILVFFLSKKLFGKKTAVIASIFLATDPLWAQFSKVAMLDIFVSTLILASAFFLWNYLKSPTFKNLLLFSGLLGLATAVKWVALFLLPAIFVFFAIQKSFKSKQKIALSHWFLILPIFGIFYFLPYLFLPSFDPKSFIHWQYQMSRTNLSGIWFNQPLTSPLWGWFFEKPVFLLSGNEAFLRGGGNPLVFWFWPIVFLVLIKETIVKLKKKSGFELFFLILTFSFLYFPWFVPIRPTFTYYILPAVPFMCIGTSWFFLKIWERNKD